MWPLFLGSVTRSHLTSLCVQHAGGTQSKEKAEWLEDVTEEWFYENKDVEPYELQDFLEEIIEAEFNLQIDDGSVGEVTSQLDNFLCSLDL